MSSAKKSPRVLRAVVTSGVTTLHFESVSKVEGQKPHQASPQHPTPPHQSRALNTAEARPPSAPSSSSSSAALIEALRTVASIGTPPLTTESIVERSDAAAIALIGCLRTRLFLLHSTIQLIGGDVGPRQQGSDAQMRALQVGGLDADHPIAGCVGACLRTQQVIVYNDVAAAPEFSPSIEGIGLRAPTSLAFAPVTIAGTLHTKQTSLGVLQVCALVLLPAAPHLTLTLCLMQIINKSAIPSVFSATDTAYLQVIAQAIAGALYQLQQLHSSRRATMTLTSHARCIPLLASCSTPSAVAFYVKRNLPAVMLARSARLLLMNHHNTDITTWRFAPGIEESGEPQKLRMPSKSIWNFALQAGRPTIVNDTHSDPRFGRDCSFGSVMLIPLYSSVTLGDKDEFGTDVCIQGSPDRVIALGLIEVKEKLSNTGFTDVDAVVAECASTAVAAVLQREDVRSYMTESSLEGRLLLTGSFLQQIRQAEALIARQAGFERCFVFLSHNEMLSHRHSDGNISTLEPKLYPFNVCCSRLSVVTYPSTLSSSSIDWPAAIGRITTSLHLESVPHSFMVLPLLGGYHGGADSMPFGVAICLQWSGAQKAISSAIRDRTLLLTTSASLVLQSSHSDITEKSRAASRRAIVELGQQLQNAAVSELVSRENAFSSASKERTSSDALIPNILPQEFLKSAQRYTSTACSAEFALIYVVSTPHSGGDRLVCVGADGAIVGQPCGRGIIGSVYRSNSPLVLHSAADDRRFVTTIDSPTSIHVKNAIFVPLPSAANASLAGGVLALYNVAPELMLISIGEQTALDAASAISNCISFLISSVASACVRQRLQGTISSLFNGLQHSFNLHSNLEISDDVLRNGCASVADIIHCDVMNVYTLRPGIDIMFPLNLPQHGHSSVPSQAQYPVKGLAGHAARTGSVVVSTSPLSDPRYSSEIDRCTPGRAPGSVLCIPVQANVEYSQALQELAFAKGSCYTFGDLAYHSLDDSDHQMQVDLWLPSLFTSTLAPPAFRKLSANAIKDAASVVAVVELVIYARKNKMTKCFKSDDVIVAAFFASQLAIAVRNSRQLMQIDTVKSYCHPMLSSLLTDSPNGAKQQVHVIESLRRTALGLCRTQFAAVFVRETSVGRDELVSIEWLSTVSGLSLSNLLESHPRLMKRFTPSRALKLEQQRQLDQDCGQEHGIALNEEGVPSVFESLSAPSNTKHGASSHGAASTRDLDVAIRLRVPVSASHGGLVGCCALRGEIVVMQQPGEHPLFKSGIDDRHLCATHSEVCAPICDCSGNVIAVLQLINHPGGFFSPEDLQAIKVFCLIASEALKEAEEAHLYRQWLTFTRGIRKILQLSLAEGGDREPNIWQTCANTLAGMMQCVAYCFVLCVHDDRRWTRYRSNGPIIKNAKRSGLPSQCIRCGDLQLQDAILRKYSGQSSSDTQGQCYLDLLSESDEEVVEDGINQPSGAENLRDQRDDSFAQSEQTDGSGPGASSYCGLLCVPLTDFLAGKGHPLVLHHPCKCLPPPAVVFCVDVS